MRRFGVALALAVSLLAACGKDDGRSSGAQKAKPKTIGVALRTRTHDFYRELEDGLRGACEARGYAMVLQSADDAPTTQAKQIEDLVVQKVDALVVVPCQSDAVAPALKRAERAGIPVFTADIAANGAKVVSHVASDNVQGGRLAGEAMAKFLGGRGKVIVIDQPTVTSVQDRVRGFEEALKKHPGIQVVGKPSGEGERVKAQAVMEDSMTKWPDLAGVFGINDDSALGALRAAESAGKKDLVIIGYDATPEAQDAIRRGSALKADVVQYPKRIGEKTIDAVATWFAGVKIDKVTPVNVGLVDAASLAKSK